MSLEIKLNERLARVELIKKENNNIKIRVDNDVYNLDIVKVGPGIYSILMDGISFNIELLQPKNKKKYTITTWNKSYEAEIVDADTRYLKSRQKDLSGEEGNYISSPMPGKIIKIPVKEGDIVKEGTTVIIVEAMKMQSEYKVKKDRIVKKVLVKEGETINSNQELIYVE